MRQDVKKGFVRGCERYGGGGKLREKGDVVEMISRTETTTEGGEGKGDKEGG